MKEQRKKLMSLVENRLAEYHFIRKKTYDVFIKKFNDNIIYTIGFGISHPNIGHFNLYPHINMLYKNVYQIEKLLIGDYSRIPPYVGGTIGTTIRYIMPEKTFIEWKFSKFDDFTSEANNMIDAIVKYGFPYLEKYSKIENIIYDLEIGEYKDIRGIKLPILHYINGNTQRAFECIDQYIKKFSVPKLEDYEIEILQKLAEENGEVYSTENRDLKNYLEFVDNFKKMVEEDAREAHGSNK